jgi:mono/diheme cytochrome c family protein
MLGKTRLKFLPPAAILCVLGLQIFPRIAQTQNATTAPKVDYQKDIQPILEKNCYSCHAAASQMSGLRLDSRQAFLAGGANGKIVVPGKAADSTLYKRVAGIGGLTRMPFGSQPLAPADIELIRAWIDQGAEIPESATAYAAPESAKKHWGFIAPVRPALPQVNHQVWVRNPIDSFILARLE